MKRARLIIMLTVVAASTLLCACSLESTFGTSSGRASSQQSFEQEPQEEGYAFTARSKTWVVLGDSLTDETYKPKKKYYDYVARDLGCTVVNYGRKGTGYMDPAQGGDSFCDRVDNLDVSDVDCLTVFGSFNDLGKGYALGTAYDDGEYSIGGCMNVTIEKLVAKNPSLKIGIVTPTPWRTNFSINSDGTDSFGTVTRWDCDAYVELLKDVAKRHRLPVLDLYETYGLDPDNERVRELFYKHDGRVDENGVHPNSEGHKFMYPQWREFVKTLLASDAIEEGD